MVPEASAPIPQEVEVAPLVRLGDVVEEEPAVAALVVRLRRGPAGAAAGQLLVRDGQVQGAALDVELDRVAVSTSASVPPSEDSGSTCSTTVPYDVPLMRARPRSAPYRSPPGAA